MRRKDDAILHREQSRYLERIAPARDSLLEEMERFAEENGHPIADHDVARLLSFFCSIQKPGRVLEVGTNIGYSVVVMGRSLDRDATIETIEIDPSTLASAKSFVRRAELECHVVYHEGAALEVLPRLGGSFDLVFIDCVKTEYEAYLDILLPELSTDSLIVFDNMLWGGEVASEDVERSVESVALDSLNRRLMSEPGLESILIPMSDGVALARVR